MDTVETLNTEAADSSTADAMLSSSTISTFGGDLAPQEASNPEEKKDEAQGASEEKATTESTATAEKSTEASAEEKKTEAAQEEKQAQKDEDRFDNHPRFKELISEKNALKNQLSQSQKTIEQLASKVNAIEARTTTPEVPVDQEIAELFEADPTKALMRIKDVAKAEAKRELLGELSERTTYNNLSTALKSYQDKNPEFTQMWESGELQAFADANPLYNTPIAAYEYLSGQKRMTALQADIDKKVADAVEAARKEEKEAADKRIKEIEANHKAKKETTVVTERASSPSSSTKSETDTSGDKTSWMVRRFHQREAGR